MSEIPVNTAVGPRIAATQAASVIRQHSRSFTFASRLLPTHLRGDVHKLYAWCRACDDAVDAAASPQEAKAQLRQLRADVQRIYQGEPVWQEASRWLFELSTRYGIPKAYPLALLDAMEMDLRLGQIRNRAELIKYCYGAAGVVGLMLCSIFGVHDPRAKEHAEALGIAMQLTNIARDVLEDSHRQRCYLPRTWLRGDIQSASNHAIRKTVRKLLDLADEYYQSANSGMKYLPSSVRPAIRIAAAVYREIGVEIRRQRYAVMRGRIVIPKPRFVCTAMLSIVKGAAFDTRHRLSQGLPYIASFKQSVFDPFPMELPMKDAKYTAWLGLSLTAYMAGALFLLVLLNPKDESYSYLPLAYGIACFVLGAIANLFAKQNEVPDSVAVRVDKD